jgi:hypothetical protein
MYSQWSDTIDSKVVAVFSVASAILGLAPALKQLHSVGASLAFWIVAASCWVFAVVFCHLAYRPRNFRVDPSPAKLLVPEWLRLDPDQYQFYRLRDMGKSYEHNRDDLDRKASCLGWAILFTAGEVFALALAFVLDPSI